MNEDLSGGVDLSDTRQPVDENSHYMRILAEAIKARPVPAIEQPLGPRTSKSAEPVVLFDNTGAFADWNETMRGREWG